MIRFLFSTLSAWLRDGRHARGAPEKTSEASAHLEANAERELSSLLRDLEENPDSLDLLLKAGVAFARRGEMPRSIEYFRRGVEIAPESPALHNNLGLSLQKTGELSDAVGCFRTALRLNADFPAAWHNLANALNEMGQVEEGREAYRRCLAIAPDHVAARSDYLLSLNYTQDLSRQQIFQEHREWARRHAIRSGTARPVSQTRDRAENRLRVAYLSPDFKNHSVAFFIEPVLEHHDRASFHVFAYADLYAGDQFTQRIAGKVESWRIVSGLEPDQLAARILEDRIDVLVDLAGHTSFRQMLLMSMRVAPVQVTYLGYPNTTGLDTVDYRLTDEIADPVGEADAFASEKLLRLPNGFLCYRPSAPEGIPEAAEPPSLNRGFVTFGSFNNFNKTSPMTLDLWAGILRDVPESRLYLKARQLADAKLRAQVCAEFEHRGIDPARIRAFPWTRTQHEHLDLYNEVDVALDTFPYNGTTTTCEAMWMGVPVVTLSGDAHASRVGLSLLRQCGLGEFAASTGQDYVQKAVALATDRERLMDLRSNLRATVASSSLMDGEGFCRRLETAYRRMIDNPA